MIKLEKIQEKNMTFVKKRLKFNRTIHNFFSPKPNYFKKMKIKHDFSINLPEVIIYKNLTSFELQTTCKSNSAVLDLFLILNLTQINGYERDFLFLKDFYRTKTVEHKGDWLVIINNKVSITKKLKTDYPKKFKKIKEYKINKENLTEKIKSIKF